MNTIVLAAGPPDYQNMAQGLTSSQLLMAVNGRPIIAWVITDLLKQTRDAITIVVDTLDKEMIRFCDRRYHKNKRIQICQIKNSPSVIHSLSAGLEALDQAANKHPLRIKLGDTLLLDHPFGNKDSVYISDFSYSSLSWCAVSLDPNKEIAAYYEKQRGLHSPKYKAVVGRYEFSNLKLLKKSVKDALNDGKKQISDVLERYAVTQKLSPILVTEKNWLDMGHLEGLSKARTRLIESRCFNTLSLHHLLPEIQKSSVQKGKISQELYWYNTLPVTLRSIAPQILSSHNGSKNSVVKMEYYGYGTLTEKFVYFDLSESFWEATLTSLFKLMVLFKELSPKVPLKEISAYGIYHKKTFARLQTFKQQNKKWRNILDKKRLMINGHSYLGIPKLQSFIEREVENLVTSTKPAIIHGDLCFNNILHDVSSGVIKLIDPRGEFGAGVKTIFGDPRYDIAKLRHSFCGNYDCMIEENYEISLEKDGQINLTVHKDEQKERDLLFDDLCKQYSYDPFEIRFIEGLLFMSMLPLHSDSENKQLAFLATGLMKLNQCYQEKK